MSSSDALALLAAELALGLLSEHERGEAERLRSGDSCFAAEVAMWEAMTDKWLGQLPDHHLEPRRPPGGAAIASVAVPARRSAWRPLAIAASLLVCGVVTLWTRTGGSAPASAFAATRRFSIAQIGGAGDPHLATVLYDRGAGTLTIRIATLTVGRARTPEIWLIKGAGPPHSLGFGYAGTATRMPASADLRRALVDGATLAITLEPVSARPHAAPSSRILGTGTISSI